jgi:hypothetical protein
MKTAGAHQYAHHGALSPQVLAIPLTAVLRIYLESLEHPVPLQIASLLSGHHAHDDAHEPDVPLPSTDYLYQVGAGAPPGAVVGAPTGGGASADAYPQRRGERRGQRPDELTKLTKLCKQDDSARYSALRDHPSSSAVPGARPSDSSIEVGEPTAGAVASALTGALPTPTVQEDEESAASPRSLKDLRAVFGN